MTEAVPIFHATAAQTLHPSSVLLKLENAPLKDAGIVLMGTFYDFKFGVFVCPREIWKTVSTQIERSEFSLEMDALSLEWLEEEDEEIRQLEHDARVRANAFNLQLHAAGHHLRDYQREAIRWLSTKKAGLLTDEQGLGKSIEALGAIPHHVGAVIVCPASLRGYWRDEIERWRPDLTPVLQEGTGAFTLPGPCRVHIVSDAALVHFEGEITTRLFLIADEAHAYKGDSKRTERMEAFCARIRAANGWTVGLTGTPLLNRPEELYTLARVFGCHRLGWGSEPAFKRAFQVTDGPFGPVYGKPLPAAYEGLARISLRRTRAEVLPELPKKSYRMIPVELPRKLTRLLDKIHADCTEELEAWEWHDVMPKFEKYAEVRADLAVLKRKSALDWVESHEQSEQPTVVFSAHRSVPDALSTRPFWTTITGDVDPEDRTTRVKLFQQGTLRGIAGTIQAMGTGHTLTRASNLLFVDRMYTPPLNEQAEDRVCRLGQTMPVLISILVADHPLEKKIETILDKKLALIRASVKSTAPNSGDE